MFALQQISKRYGNKVVLNDINLELTPGETTMLLGPSGCGKTTLLRVMVGIVTPDTGQVTFAGEPLAPANVNRLRQRLGYILQDGGLFPHLTARENVQLVARILGWSAEQREERTQALAQLVDLPPESLDRYPTQVSGGQRQRISLMRALMLDPEVLLFDEPLGALDPIIRADLQQQLRDIFRQLHKTVVIVTHDMGEAVYLGHQLVLLNNGQIEQQGPPRALVHHPASPFVEHFINSQRSPLDALDEEA